MSNLNVIFPNYTIGASALEGIGNICLQYGKKILVVGGKTALEKARNKLEKALNDSSFEEISYMVYGNDCTIKNINLVVDEAKNKSANLIIGVGGGKAIDTAKAAANRLDLPVFTVPTIASTCAGTTSLSVVYTDKGDFDDFDFQKSPTIHCFMDSEIISEAPYRYLWAGIGDTMAKYYEVSLATRGDQLNHSSGLGKEISAMCVNPLINYGVKALEDCKNNTSSFEIEQVVLNNIVSTGYVSMLVEEKYNGALAHSLFYGMTLLEHIEERHLHGEVVAYGVLVQLAMDDDIEELERLTDFYKKIKLPICLEDIEVKNDRNYLEHVLDSAVNSPDMEYLPYKVTKDMIFDAIQMVEQKNI